MKKFESLKPPRAEKNPQELQGHGDTRIDEFFWLRKKESKEVKDYLNAENQYLEGFFGDGVDLRKELFEELKSRIKKEDESVPYKMRGFEYFTRISKEDQYPRYFRRVPGSDKSVCFLDLNALRGDLPFLSLGAISISPDDRFMAYALDEDGSEIYRIYFKDLETEEVLEEKIEGAYASFEWSQDGGYFFYAKLNKLQRPDRVYRHKFRTEQSEDVLVYQEAEPEYFVGCDKTKDDKYLMVASQGAITSEVRYLDATKPLDEFQVILPRERGVEYSAEHREGFFYIHTNKNAQNFKIARQPVGGTDQDCEDFIPHRPEIFLEDMDVFQGRLAMECREKGLTKIRFLEFDSQKVDEISFPEPAYAVSLDINREFQTEKFRYAYSSMVTPPSVIEWDPETKGHKVLKEKEIPGGYDKKLYKSERFMAKSHDGVEVPVSIVYRADFKRDGKGKCYLYAYGSYGHSMPASFSENRLSLLDRGFCFAIAHVRGGSDLGRQWYEDGKFLKKKNTFHDFIAVGEHLIKEGFASPDGLVISGGSAGGMLIGASINMRPDLFSAAVASVPFVDVLTTMQDKDLPLTALEYDEWGNPDDPEYYNYIKSYSPYDNVEAKPYPNLLVTAGLNDPRVTYWEPAKWVARLRDRKTDKNVLLLHTNMEAGHAGASGRYERLKELAMEYAFIIRVI